MLNISDSIKYGAEELKLGGINEPRKEASSLLCFVLQKDKTFLIAHSEYVLTEAENRQFEIVIKRRSEREPFQHITGKQEFWGLDFAVSPDVLIPRPETELIVENAIELLQDSEKPNFCEIGIGSGCISISILREIRNARTIGVDISEKAIAIAEQNAYKHGVSDRLNIIKSDVFEALSGEDKFDLIVSNPPYISNRDIENLQKEVRDFDPKIALTDGKDGLSIIKKIINDSPKHLKTGGCLLTEIGFDQSENVRGMFDLEIWQSLEFLPDLQGISRMVKVFLI